MTSPKEVLDSLTKKDWQAIADRATVEQQAVVIKSLQIQNAELQKELQDCELLLMECLQVLYDINEGNVREGSLH